MTSIMNATIMDNLLATFSVVKVTEAYTGNRLFNEEWIKLRGKLTFSNVLEIRFRVDECPEVFYRTKISDKFLNRE